MRSTPATDAKLQARLAEAVTAFGGGSADAFGRLIGYTNGGYIREILSGKKPVREALIDRVHTVETMRGWFVEALGSATTESPAPGVNIHDPQPAGLPLPDRLTKTADVRPVGAIAVGALAIRASMGLGADRPSRDEVVAEMVIDERWLRRNCTFTSPENLSLITGVGDSMRPTFEDGDALLVDRGIREARVDGIYALALNDELYIKRIQRRPDGTLVMISDNRSYEPYTITGGRDRLDVLGRVVMSWCAQRL